MNYNKILILFSLLTPSICSATNSYELYKDTVKNCVDMEKNKTPVTPHDLNELPPEDIRKFLFLIKDIRIQHCSYQQEMRALVDELSANNESVDTKDLQNRYLSIYNNRRLKALNDEEKDKLNQLDASLKNKSLEINLLDLWDELKNN